MPLSFSLGVVCAANRPVYAKPHSATFLHQVCIKLVPLAQVSKAFESGGYETSVWAKTQNTEHSKASTFVLVMQVN